MRRPGVPLISALSALSLCRSRTAVKGISLRAIATALTKTREELERQGLAAIWFEVVNSHKQNGGNDADAEDVNESQHSDIPRLLRSLRGHCANEGGVIDCSGWQGRIREGVGKWRKQNLAGLSLRWLFFDGWECFGR